MKIFPAIDIKDKKCVRLIKGDFNQKTEYQMSPVEQATQFIDKGFKNLHIIDLDGALAGETVNLDIIKELASKKKNQFIVGFALETDNVEKNAIMKILFPAASC